MARECVCMSEQKITTYTRTQCTTLYEWYCQDVIEQRSRTTTPYTVFVRYFKFKHQALDTFWGVMCETYCTIYVAIAESDNSRGLNCWHVFKYLC